ncbi:TonB-dependent receptor domain-containing protein [Lutimonas zeaxanthinifaciens]|uniref:TonB-dependent receptor domain-containing protein n=1 Tax=Lutimonas zeaxanthinifaciens TaxID=3060215 RepID=UPI00265D1B00|nr:TonB-dependent receptor [Lutimonas sp. YSD2104]WKK66897.1 TonB-dependent receptor [Lutimonas sp. YSD2104]
MKLPLIFILFFFITAHLSSQERKRPPGDGRQQREMFEIVGQVYEKNEKIPLEFTTVIVKPLRGPKIFGGMTDDKGNFLVEAPKGRYNISFEFLSFKTITLENIELNKNLDLGEIFLEEDSEALEEVEVIAEKSTMEVRLDKKIYNVGKDMTVKGGTASDVLDNVPSVTVDAEGVVSLRGNENVRILIDGKPSGLIGLNDTEALRQFPADAIAKVEVITSPSARYDAEGTAGILNIILRRDKATGFNGVGTLNLGEPKYYGGSASLNYRLEKVNFFTNIGYSDREAPGNASYETNYFSPNATYPYTDQKIDYNRSRKNLNANIGLEYYFTKNTSLTGSFLYRDSKRANSSENFTDAYNDVNALANTTFRNENQESDGNVFQYDLNFLHKFKNEGHQIDLDLQYQDNSQTENSLITNQELYPEQLDLPSQTIFSDEVQKRFLLQSDYVLPIGENQQVELGVRINAEDRDTDYRFYDEDENGDFIVNDSLTNFFEYEEMISAIYGQYGNKFGKFSALVGLRVEGTDIDIRSTGKNIDSVNTKNYVNFFPTVNLVYEFTESENLTLGYNSRIRRPRSWFINPFPSQSSQTTIFQGNPDLDPSISHGVDLGYFKRWQKVTFNTSVYYSRATDVFQFISQDTGETTEDGIPIIRRTPINLSTEDRYGTEFSANYTPKKNWRFNLSFNFYNSTLDGEYDGVDFGSNFNSWFTRASSKITLPAEIDWQTTLMYRGPRQNAQTKTDGMFMANMAFSKDILKGNGTLVFNVDDMFNSRKRVSNTLTDSFEQKSEFQWRQRQFRLSFTYRFNQKKQRQRQRNGMGGDEGGEFGG